MKVKLALLFIITILTISGIVIANAEEVKVFKPSESFIGTHKRVIILYKAETTDEDVDELEKKGARIKHKYKTIRAISAYVDEEDIDNLELDEDVEAVFEDMRVYAFLSDSVPQINADQVHLESITGSGVKVCVVDTGVDDSHPDLNSLVAEYDFVNGDADATDDNGHGTHVAGIVASTDATYKGVAYNAFLMAAKVLDDSGSGWSSDVIAGIEWCVANGADIISMSLGGGLYTSACDSNPTAQASNNAVDQGVVVLAATGNDGYINAIASPACGSKVIAVGAVDKSDGRTPYSNEGSELDIVAPGTGITSTYLGGGFVTLTGTSMATPHVSATAALVLETDPSLIPTQVRTILQDTAFDLGAVGFDTIYGYGRVDAYAAYQYALNPPPTPDQVFFDDLQSGSFDKWTESNEFDWNVENPAERQVPGKTSSNLVAHADNCDSFCVLTMKNSIDLSGYESASLKFWRYVDRALDNGEFLKVEAFDGSSWNQIYYWTNRQGDDDVWHYETYNLPSQYLVNNFNVRFTTKMSSTGEDAEFDDFLVEGVPTSVPGCTVNSDCDDGLYCNGVETCEAGVCQAGTPVDCSGLDDQCNVGVCDEATDSCEAQPKPDGIVCDDGLFCNGVETCEAGVCQSSTPVDCSANDINEIATCTNSPDDNPFTWDYREAFVSQCTEPSGECTTGDTTITYTCDTVQCGAECDATYSCLDTNCDNLDECVGNDYYDYNDVANACLGDCSCESNACGAPTIYPDDPICTECQNDADCDNGLYCDGVETCNLDTHTCEAGIAVNCNDGNGCTIDSCNEALDACENTNVADNTVCTDGVCCSGVCTVEVTECTTAVKCWSAEYTYLKRSRSQFRKFCKCAEGNYGYQRYSYVRGRNTAYQYIDASDNENWETKYTSTYYPAYRVRCSDGNWYNTDKDYYYS